MTRRLDPHSRTKIALWLFCSSCLAADTLFYLYLPVIYATIGISLTEVGILLSINRVIRVVVRAVGIDLSLRVGERILLHLSLGGTLVSSGLYILAPFTDATFLIFLIGRVIWGLSFLCITTLLDLSVSIGTGERSRNIGLRGSLMFLLPTAYLAIAALGDLQKGLSVLLISLAALTLILYLYSVAGLESQANRPENRVSIKWRDYLDFDALSILVFSCAASFLLVDLAPSLVAEGATWSPLVALAASMIVVRMSPLLLNPAFGALAERVRVDLLLIGLFGLIGALAATNQLWGIATYAVVFGLLVALLHTAMFILAVRGGAYAYRITKSSVIRFASEVGTGIGPLLIVPALGVDRGAFSVALGGFALVVVIVKLAQIARPRA